MPAHFLLLFPMMRQCAKGAPCGHSGGSRSIRRPLEAGTCAARRPCAPYAQRGGLDAFLFCVVLTSGRTRGEFLRVIHNLDHRRTLVWSWLIRDEATGAETLTKRRVAKAFTYCRISGTMAPPLAS